MANSRTGVRWRKDRSMNVIEINLSMTTDRPGIAEMMDGMHERTVEPGTTVEYVCHKGWSVLVRFDDGTEGLMNPNCFSQLRA